MDKVKKFFRSKVGKALLVGLIFSAGQAAEAAGFPDVADAAKALAALVGAG